MISQQRAEELAHKLLKNTISPAEEQEWREWYLSNLEEPLKVPESFAASRSLHAARMLRSINHAISEHGVPEYTERRVIRLWPKIGVAVAAVAAITLGAWLYYASDRHRYSDAGQEAGLVMKNDIAPGRNVATLTFDNGEVFELNKEEKLDISSVAVEPLKEGSETAPETPQFLASRIARSRTVVLRTPRGGQYQVVLPDGTKVWLNAESKISFPSQFSGRERKVMLEGEAYFAVVHNAKQPFRVESRAQVVEDIGTEFNISAYGDEKEVKTTLVEGEAAVNGTVLKPNQQATLNGEELTVKAVDPSEAIGWQKGLFVFENENIKSVLRKVSRWYNVEVRYEPGTESARIGGVISRYERVGQVLEMINATKTVHCSLQGRTVTVRKFKPN